MYTPQFASAEYLDDERPRRGTATPNILVVDDDPAFRELLTEFMWEAGYKVRAACDGLDAFGHVDPRIDEDGVRTDIDLVILDMSMPRMTGLQFARHLRAWSLVVPVITMTAFPAASFYRESRELGCIAALAKPFSFVQLLNFTDDFFDR